MAGNVTGVNIFEKAASVGYGLGFTGGAEKTAAPKSTEQTAASSEVPSWLKDFKNAITGAAETKPATATTTGGTTSVQPAGKPQEVTRVAGTDANIFAQTSSIAKAGMRAYDTNYWVNETMPQMTSKPGGGYGLAAEKIRYLG